VFLFTPGLRPCVILYVPHPDLRQHQQTKTAIASAAQSSKRPKKDAFLAFFLDFCPKIC